MSTRRAIYPYDRSASFRLRDNTSFARRDVVSSRDLHQKISCYFFTTYYKSILLDTIAYRYVMPRYALGIIEEDTVSQLITVHWLVYVD